MCAPAPEKVLKILCQNRKKMDDEIRFYQDASSVVDAFIGLIQEGMSITENEITLNEMPERRIILGDKNHIPAFLLTSLYDSINPHTNHI